MMESSIDGENCSYTIMTWGAPLNKTGSG